MKNLANKAAEEQLCGYFVAETGTLCAGSTQSGLSRGTADVRHTYSHTHTHTHTMRRKLITDHECVHNDFLKRSALNWQTLCSTNKAT